VSHQEEEIPLTKAATTIVDTPAQPLERQPAQTGDLSQLITGATTDAEIVEAITRAPQEQLIPWEEVSLPSKGLYYGWAAPVIRVRAWGAKVDKILATARMAQSGQSLDFGEIDRTRASARSPWISSRS
jgi:hypothetical protein